MPQKIIFMHGLESGILGKKSQYLRENFENVYTPDMQMSMLNLKKKNSIIRNVTRTWIFRMWTFFIIIVLFRLSYDWQSLASLFFSFVSFFLIKKRIFQSALSMSLQQCTSIQSKALQDFKPDLVVGSSWGGLIALNCITQKIYNCPVVLIAPPVKMVLNKVDFSGQNWENICEKTKQISSLVHIVHGENDKVVSIEDSKKLVEKTKVSLQIIPQGDHSLNYPLLEQQNALSLKNIIRELENRFQ
ncbi:alpha/beta hydrolase [Candidatus Uabimicrobium sp. HlEnr_7]|uniref:alpha/beta hydrolase n=1 Tax=Candidatus Uabimicrobium helgolandensis TaxID=3095367 RepID=UPI003558DFC4